MADTDTRARILAALKTEVGGSDGLWADALHLLHFPITPHSDGGWSVWRSINTTGTVLVDACYKCAECSEPLCIHSFAAMIHDRAQEKSMPTEAPKARFTTDDMMDYKGKDFVFYHALLREAQHQGLQTLHAAWTYNDASLSLASASAVFADGRTYVEAGDATPENVGSFVKPHFRRMALTRAKARALRDALGIQECSFEEVGDEEKPVPQAQSVPQMTPAPAVAKREGVYLASKLVVDTLPSGNVAFKVLSDDFPEQYQTSKYPGIIIWDNGLKASGFDPDILDVDNPPDIRGYQVEWEEYKDKGGAKRARVNRLIPVGTPTDTGTDGADGDVPF